MGWLNTILVRKARRFLWCVTGGMIVVLLALSCVEVKSSCPDGWDEAMNILFLSLVDDIDGVTGSYNCGGLL